MKWTAIIPMRGGSKGLPGKNVKNLNGKPLYLHSIELARSCGANLILITTDMDEVLDKDFSSDVVLIRRPVELSLDSVPMSPVIRHALTSSKIKGTMVLLQPTSPMRSQADLHEALNTYASNRFDLVLSVVRGDSSILKWGQISDSKFNPISESRYCFENRQNLPSVFKPNGAFFVFNSEWFIDNDGFTSENIGAFEMPIERSRDIDTIEDFRHCAEILSQLNGATL